MESRKKQKPNTFRSAVFAAMVTLCLAMIAMFAYVGVTGGVAMHASAATEKYSVTLPTVQTGYSLHSKQAGQTEVLAGDDYTFVFGVKSDYSESDYTVKINGEAVSFTGSEYTVRDVREPLVITVEGVVKNRYAVVLPKSEDQKGYVLEYSGIGEVVEAGEEVAVKLTVTDTNVKAKYLLFVNGAQITTGADGVYRAAAYGDMLFTVEYKQPVKINFNANGGSGQISAGSYYAYGETVPLNMTPELERDGYTFYGWSESASTVRPEYRDGAETAFIAGDESQVTLYAIWKAADSADPAYPTRLDVWGYACIFGGAALLVLVLAIIYGSVRKRKTRKVEAGGSNATTDEQADRLS